MSILETILVYAAIPLVIYGFFALVTLRSKFTSRPRYRPGQAWEHPPLWWTGNREGADHAHADDGDAGNAVVSTARGGARGNW